MFEVILIPEFMNHLGLLARLAGCQDFISKNL